MGWLRKEKSARATAVEEQVAEEPVKEEPADEESKEADEEEGTFFLDGEGEEVEDGEEKRDAEISTDQLDAEIDAYMGNDQPAVSAEPNTEEASQTTAVPISTAIPGRNGESKGQGKRPYSVFGRLPTSSSSTQR